LRKKNEKVAGVFSPCHFIFVAFLKSGEMPDYTDYEAITRITNTFKNREISGESFFEICVIRVREVLFQSTLYRGERR